MDKVFITGLKADAVIGIHDWERNIRQTIVVDLELGWDCSAAAASDNIDDALDYFAVCEAVTGLVSGSKHYLIEALADSVVQLIHGQFGVDWVCIKLHKPGAVSGAVTLGVEITRDFRGLDA